MEIRKTMKIAFIHQPIFYVPINKSISVPLLTHEIAKRLAKSHEVTVYAATNKLRKVQLNDEDINYIGIPTKIDQYLLKILKLSQKLKLLDSSIPIFSSDFYYLLYLFQIAIDCQKQQYDLVHILNFSQAIPLIKFFNPKIKIVLRMGMDWLSQIDQHIINKRLKSADLIIGCSDYITKRIKTNFPEYSERCCTIYNGTDISFFANFNQAKQNNLVKKLLFVGRVSPEKGVHILLDAFAQVVNQYPQVELEIIGKTTMLPLNELIAISEHPKIKELECFYPEGRYLPETYLKNLQERIPPEILTKVCFRGAISHQELNQYFQNADLFIHPSIFDDPFPNSVLEAMAAGLPVIGTNAGGIIESVEEGKTGLLVERSDVNALAEAILCLLLDENLTKAMGKAARERAVKFFDWEITVNNLLSQYRQL